MPSAIWAEQPLSYVPSTYPPKLFSASCRPGAPVEGPVLRRRCRAVRNALVQALASCATAALLGAAVAAPAPLALTEAQQLAIERSLQVVTYDSAMAAARDMAVAAAQSPEPTLKFGVDHLPVEGADRFSFGRNVNTIARTGLAQPLSPEMRQALAERYA